MLIIEGIPLLCLEMAVGQRLGRNSAVEAWKDLSPSLRGIGISAALMSLVTVFYYNYIVAWCLYYFVHSIRRTLFWSTCPTVDLNGTKTDVKECAKSSPAEYYWYRDTLDVADDIDKSTGEKMTSSRYFIRNDLLHENHCNSTTTIALLSCFWFIYCSFSVSLLPHES